VQSDDSGNLPALVQEKGAAVVDDANVVVVVGTAVVVNAVVGAVVARVVEKVVIAVVVVFPLGQVVPMRHPGAEGEKYDPGLH